MSKIKQKEVKNAEVALVRELTEILKWEEQVAAGIVDAISQAQSRDAVNRISNDYIGSNAAARAAVERYCQTKKFFATTPNDTSGSIAQQHFALSDEDLKASLFMGINVKTVVKRSNKTETSSDSQQRVLVKKVVNCLSCGKIFDCRRPGPDAIKFLSHGGLCTFCGSLVRLEYSDGTDNGAVQVSREAEAEALRERLVQFDRHSAKRTTVIDDQSDYFAIDSNAWLSDEERAELKRRQAEIEALADRKQLRITIDLLGRRVIQHDSEITDENDGKRNVNDDLYATAMAATLAEKPQGGGSAVSTAALLNNGRHNIKMQACPSMAAAKYTFMPREEKDRKSSISETPHDNSKSKTQNHTNMEYDDSFQRLQDEDPFDRAARELAEILASG